MFIDIELDRKSERGDNMGLIDMHETINPEQLNQILADDNGPLLLVCIDRHIVFQNQEATLEQLFKLFGDRLNIQLITTEYQNALIEKFAIHGFPAFIFCERGQSRDVLLGEPDPETLQKFVFRNFFSAARTEVSHNMEPYLSHSQHFATNESGFPASHWALPTTRKHP